MIFNKNHWKNNWHNNIAHNIANPFLQLIAGDILVSSKKEHIKGYIIEQDNKKKIILEESAKAREKRVRNRGREIYKDFKEKYPNKK